MNKRIYILAAAAAMCLSSCNGFLDKMPDNRAEIDTEEKVVALLTSAYPETCYIMVTEMMSDNVDDYRISYKHTDRFVDETFAWMDCNEDDNESTENIWQSAYSATAAANEALQAIEKMGCDTEVLRQAKAEALLCRAYNHFVLATIFCMPFTEEFADVDLGIPYMSAPETALNPKYERGTLRSVYEKIDADLQEALPLQGDGNYTVPKYHFNRKAAYAFAARFYLFYEKWDLAEKYASMCLGSTPETLLRDWKAIAALPTSSYNQHVNQFINANEPANFLLLTAYSAVGLAFGPYAYFTGYSHGAMLAETETMLAQQLWGQGIDRYINAPKQYENALDRVIWWKIPYLFEYTDPVAGIGYYRTVYPAFWADETLLCRAEARVMQEKYDEAAEDINLWIHNMTTQTKSYTKNDIVNFYKNIGYYEWNKPTIKKKLNPSFDIGEDGGVKECMLQCVLGIRRLETIQQGMRWFDMKRYGMEADRRVMDAAGKPAAVTDHLEIDDLRKAVQVPLKVTDAGLEKNPR